MQVPNKLQRTYKLYVDWEVLTAWFGDDFFKPGGGACTEHEKVEALRALAQGCPGRVIRILSELELLPCPGSGCVQVAVTEGTRWIERDACHKISFHFVFQIFVTRQQYEQVWQAVLEYLGSACKPLLDFFRKIAESEGITEKRCVVREVLPIVPAPLLPLVGVDQHCWSNLEQGLAFPLSRKKVGEERSRFVRIAHIQCSDGCEMFSEIPCKRTWCAHVPIGSPGPKPRDMDPSVLLDALLVVSICLPSPRCIGLVQQGAGTYEIHGDVDESSRCSTASTVRGCDGGAAHGSGVQRLLFGSRTRVSTPRTCNQQQQQGDDSVVGGVWRLTGAQRRALTGSDLRGGSYDAGWMRRADLCAKGRVGARGVGVPEPAGTRGNGKRKQRAGEGEALWWPWPEDDPRGEAACRIPKWFLDILHERSPGFAENLTTGMRYGSRPSCASGPGAGGLLFQLNKCAGCLCVNRLMQVPFRGHATHSSNGTLFYVDGEDVYATCLKDGCKAAMMARREADWFLADRLQRLLLRGETLVDPLHKSTYFRRAVGAAGLALLDGIQGDIDAVRGGGVTSKGCCTVQFLEGSHLHYPAEGEVGEGCLCVSSMVKAPSSMMCNSLNGKRTWVQLTREMLLDYFDSVTRVQ